MRLFSELRKGAGVTTDNGESIDLPSCNGRVTKWASGRITMDFGRNLMRANGALRVEVEMNSKDAKALAEHVSQEIEKRGGRSDQ